MDTLAKPTAPKPVAYTPPKWTVTKDGRPVFTNSNYEVVLGFLMLQLVKDFHSCYTLTKGNTHRLFEVAR